MLNGERAAGAGLLTRSLRAATDASSGAVFDPPVRADGAKEARTGVIEIAGLGDRGNSGHVFRAKFPSLTLFKRGVRGFFARGHSRI